MNIPNEIHIWFHFEKLKIEFPAKLTFEYVEGMNLKDEKQVTEGIKDLNEAAK